MHYDQHSLQHDTHTFWNLSEVTLGATMFMVTDVFPNSITCQWSINIQCLFILSAT